MAQTKRKRRTKHRGNAAGAVEVRGRTGRKPTAQETKGRTNASTSRGPRPVQPPSWTSALGKAAFGSIILFALLAFGVLGNDASTANALFVAMFALIAYTPVMYVTDRFIYNRRLAKEKQ